MVEVFKTNVEDREKAREILDQIRERFPGYQVNFDLDDCDRILRIKSVQDAVAVDQVVELLACFGFQVAVLDESSKP